MHHGSNGIMAWRSIVAASGENQCGSISWQLSINGGKSSSVSKKQRRKQNDINGGVSMTAARKNDISVVS